MVCTVRWNDFLRSMVTWCAQNTWRGRALPAGPTPQSQWPRVDAPGVYGCGVCLLRLVFDSAGVYERPRSPLVALCPPGTCGNPLSPSQHLFRPNALLQRAPCAGFSAPLRLKPSSFFFFFFFFFFTLVTGPRRSLSLQLSDTRVCGPQIRVRLILAGSARSQGGAEE